MKPSYLPAKPAPEWAINIKSPGSDINIYPNLWQLCGACRIWINYFMYAKLR
jgi:hypothetical protein